MGEIALQTSWGVPIALYLFLGGLAGGTALVSGVIQLKWGERFRNIVRFGAWAAVVLLIAGVLCLISEVTMPLRAMQMWVAFTNPSSWMTIGAWLLVAGIVGIGLFALAATPAVADKVLGSKAPAVKRVLAVVAAVLGGCVALYTGILIGVLVNHPLWNSWIVPVLFTVSAIDTGLALITAYLCLGRPVAAPKKRANAGSGGSAAKAPANAAFATASAGEAAAISAASVEAVVTEVTVEEVSPADQAELSKLTSLVEKSSAVLIVAELLVLALFLLMANGAGEVGALSVWVLTAGPLAAPFWLLLVVCGLVLPLIAEVLIITKSPAVARNAKPVTLLASALVLIGGCALRFLVLYAGLPLSL